jgi:hypothetical protein
MLKWYHNEGNFSFNSIIADNEIWIYHYEPWRKCQRMLWK